MYGLAIYELSKTTKTFLYRKQQLFRKTWTIFCAAKKAKSLLFTNHILYHY